MKHLIFFGIILAVIAGLLAHFIAPATGLSMGASQHITVLSCVIGFFLGAFGVAWVNPDMAR